MATEGQPILSPETFDRIEVSVLSNEKQAILLQEGKRIIVERHAQDPYSAHRKCEDCGLYTGCRSPFMRRKQVTEKPKILIVGEAPGQEEDERGAPFEGTSGGILQRALFGGKNPRTGEYTAGIGIPRTDVAFTNTVVCRPPNNELKGAAGKTIVTFCREGVLREIQDVDPDIVVLAGNIPLGAVLGLDGIQTMSGKVIYSTDVHSYHEKPFPFEDSRDRAYMPLLHPASLTYEGGKARLPIFLDGIVKLRTLWDGTYQRVKPKPPTKVLLDFDETVAYLRDLLAAPKASIDIETDQLDAYVVGAEILTIGIAILQKDPEIPEYGEKSPWILPEYAVSIPLLHPESPWTEEQLVTILEMLIEFLTDPTKQKLFHNGKFETTWFALKLMIRLRGLLNDTMFEHFVVDEMPGTHALKGPNGLVNKYTPFEDYDRDMKRLLAEAGGIWRNVALLPTGTYNAGDAYVTAYLENVFYPWLHRENQWDVYRLLMEPMVSFLTRMELKGIAINKAKAQDIKTALAARGEMYEKHMRSVPQIGEAESLTRRQLEVKEQVWKNSEDLAKRRKKVKDLEQQQAHFPFPEETTPERELKKIVKAAEKLDKELAEARRLEGNSLERYRNKVTKIEDETIFNFGSDVHLHRLFFEVMGLRVLSRTPTGAPQLNADVLEVYAKRYPIASYLSRLRTVEKHVSTYLEPILTNAVIKPDGLLHANVMPLAVTGRLMSGSKNRGKSGEAGDSFKYNIQNIPRPYVLPCHEHIRVAKKDLFKISETCKQCLMIRLRAIFQTRYICDRHKPVADPQCDKCGRIVSGDYCQLEFMLMGILAQEPAVLKCIEVQQECERRGREYEEAKAMGLEPELLEAFKKETELMQMRADIHRISSSMAYGKPPEAITKEERQDIKSAVSFGLIYGRGADALADDMGWTLAYTQEFIRKFFDGYPNMKRWLDEQVAFVKKHGYILSPLGRKRRLPNILSTNASEANHARNEAVNFPIQGPASDFNSLSAIALQAKYEDLGMESAVVKVEHDATYSDCPPGEWEAAMKLKQKTMEEIPLQFPFMTHRLRAEVHCGASMDQ
jgi:uracil-DNA glycosylase family 4